MSYTFLKAKGYEIGTSVLDENNIEFAKKIINEYSDKLVLPVDVKVTKEFSNDSPSRVTNVTDIKEDEMLGKIVEIFCPSPNRKVIRFNNDGKNYLVPYIDNFVKLIDLANKKVILYSMEGVIECE